MGTNRENGMVDSSFGLPLQAILAAQFTVLAVKVMYLVLTSPTDAVGVCQGTVCRGTGNIGQVHHGDVNNDAGVQQY